MKRARKRRAAATALFAILALSCADADNIDVAVESTTTVPRGTIADRVLGDLRFLGFDGFDIAESREFRNQGYTRDQIDSVVLTEFRLTVVAPDAGTLDFLSNISFFIEADGLPRILVASAATIPEGTTDLVLDLEMAELADYVTSDTVEISTEATGLAPDDDTDVRARAVFDVDIDVGDAVGCQAAARLAR